jgi:hypothetical protein
LAFGVGGFGVADELPILLTSEDRFVEAEDHLAAQVRQLFRAHRAGDEEATQVELTYLDHFLTLTVRRLLQFQDPVWDGSRRWFDGLNARPDYEVPGRLRLRGEVCWVSGQEHWYFDPFDAEIELYPRTGAFRSLVVRFGDQRPLSAKVNGSAVSGIPVGGWSFTIERHRAEQFAQTDRRSVS